MLFRILADLVVALHMAFIVFVVLGGLLVLWRPRLAVLHLPAALWGLFVELTSGLCPLTPLEQQLRLQANQQGYVGGFIEHYLLSVIYPSGLTYRLQLLFAAAVLSINAAVYAMVFLRMRRRNLQQASRER